MALNAAGYAGALAGMLTPVAGSSVYQAVGGTSAQMTIEAAAIYVFTCSVDCYLKQGSNPTASAGTGSMFVPRGLPILILGAKGTKVAVIQTDTAGAATLQKMVVA